VKQRSFSRGQRTTILVAILCVVITIVVMQLWLLTATMDAFLRRDESVLIPAAIASFACLALNIGLLVHHRKVDD
jgi:hypothetical protein